MNGSRALIFSVVVGSTLVAACTKASSGGVLQPQDLATSADDTVAFDRNTLVDSTSFTDADTLDAVTLQRFLARTPYERASFLETYQSNGVRVADAMVDVAKRYRINPLVFLVFLEITQGLVGAADYVFPPERVDFVFRCGCSDSQTCLPESAGIDRQLQCLAQGLRASIDDIKANDRTASGWGPDIASVTLDGVKVTPSNEVTAAVYAFLPRVHQGGDNGAWAFWKVWQVYADALQYSPFVDNPDGRWIGDACSTTAMCSAVQDGICADHYPDGLCTVTCTGACPSQPSRAASFCAKFADAGYCLTICNPAAPNCRPGYSCVRVVGVVDGDSEHVCSPQSN